jgi:hypothetical protein
MMGFKVSKTTEKERQDFLTRLRKAEEDIKTAVQDANTAIAEAAREVTSKTEEYNVIVKEVEEWKDNLANEWREAFDAKSEAWQEGDNGSQADEFISEWENLTTDELDDVEATEIETPDFDLADDLEGLPSE